MHPKRLAAAAAVTFVLVVLVAAAGWDRYVVVRKADRLRLAHLVVSSPPPGYTTKPANASEVPASSNPFAAFKADAKKAPSDTGAYSVSWTNPKSSNDSASILASYLSSPAAAATVEAQAEKQFLAAGSFASEKYRYANAVAVPGIPGAKGAVFVATGTSTTPPVAAVTFATGRVQTLVLVGQVGTPASTSETAAALARSEYLHLRQALPGFDLQVTRVPLVATILYWAVVAGLIALGVVIPLGVRRGRRMRREARLRTARRQQQVRGSKIARRQATRRR